MIIEKFKESSLVDLLAIITPFIIIMGLMHKVGIYTSEKVDASWFISIFSPVDFMISDLTIYFYFAIALLYLEKVIFNSEMSPIKELISANIQLLSAYAGIFLILYLQHKSISSFLDFYILIALSLNGFGILMLSKRLGKIIGIGLILLVPFTTGATHSKQIEKGNLPLVELNDKKKWYLLDKHSDQLILINIQDKKNEFKIVEMKEIKILK